MRAGGPLPTTIAAVSTTLPLDVLVVNHGPPVELARCLASVAEFLPGEQVRVWDNLSADSPQVREFAAAHPSIDWNFSDRGIGFAAGMNRLMARSDRDVLMLNPDAVLTGPLTRTRSALDEDRVAAASSTVVDPTGRTQRWDIAHRSGSVLRTLVSHSGYATRLRATPLSDLYPEPPEVVGGYLTGCSLMVSRAAWDDVGPFDERFFVYGEDPDWQGRARRRGWRLRMVDESGITHVSSQAGDAPASPRMSDLRAANTAVVLGMRGGMGPGALLIAGDLLLGRVQRSKRRHRAQAAAHRAAAAAGRTSVVLTTPDLDDAAAERVDLANELAGRGHAVTVVCLDGLGAQQRRLDTSVRMLLRPWWLPSVDTTVPGPAVLIGGDTPAEVRFAAAWTARGGRRWVVAGPELGGPQAGRWSGLLRRAIRTGRAHVSHSADYLTV